MRPLEKRACTSERPWQNLAGNPAFKIAKARALEDAHFFAFANYTDLWRLMAMEMEEDWLAFERSGFPQLTATAHSGRFTREGVVDKLSFILRGRARGMWRLLKPEPLSRKPWRMLPAFTSGFVSMRLARGLTKPFLDMLRAMDPEMADDFVEPFRDFREETGVSVEKDIFPLLTGEFTVAFFEEPGKPEEREEPLRAGPGEEKSLRLSLGLVELADPERARAVMDRLTRDRVGGEPLARKRRFGALDGWEVEFGFEKYHLAGSGRIAFVALAPEPITRLAKWLEEGGKRLVDAEEFKKATRWIPADAGLVCYSNADGDQAGGRSAPEPEGLPPGHVAPHGRPEDREAGLLVRDPFP